MSEAGEKKLQTVKLITPSGLSAETECDSFVFLMAEDRNGKGEGSIGIRPGHADAVICIAPGPFTARLRGNSVLSGKLGGGFVMVKNSEVTVLSDDVVVE